MVMARNQLPGLGGLVRNLQSKQSKEYSGKSPNSDYGVETTIGKGKNWYIDMRSMKAPGEGRIQAGP